MIDPFPCFYSHLKRRSPLYCPKGRNIPYVWRLFSLPDQISYRQSRPASRILLHSLCWVSSMVGRAAFSPTLMRNLMPSLHISYGNGELKPWPFWGQSVSLLLDKWHITRQSFQRNSSSAGPQVTLLCINHPCLNSLAVCITMWQSLEMKPLVSKQPQTTLCMPLVSESKCLAREVTAELSSES